MKEVIAEDYGELACMVQQNIANQRYDTGQPRILVVLYSPLVQIFKLMEYDPMKQYNLPKSQKPMSSDRKGNRNEAQGYCRVSERETRGFSKEGK